MAPAHPFGRALRPARVWGGKGGEAPRPAAAGAKIGVRPYTPPPAGACGLATGSAGTIP
jgi:hypothetical protein